MVATIFGPSMKPLFDYVAQRGHDPSELVRPFGVELARFDDASLRVPVTLTDRLWEYAAVVCDDPNLALHVAGTLGPGRGGIIAYLAAYSADLRAALERLVRFWPTISSLTRYRLEVGEHTARLTCDMGRPCPGRQPEEVATASVAQFARRMCGPSFAVVRASFRSPAPPRLDEHVAVFGPDLTFEASETWIELATEMLSLPMKTPDEELAGLLEVAATRESAPVTDGDLTARTRLQIAELLSLGKRAQCEDVASRMGMSPRTLRRKLSELGCSYRTLLDAVLSGMADQLLLDPHVSLEDVASRLRFSDLRALSNATRRWFGMTPQQYRRLSEGRPRS